MCKSSICTWAQLDYIWNEMDYLVTPDVVCILHINWICIDAYSKFHSLSLRLMWMVRTLHHCSSTWNHRKEASDGIKWNFTKFLVDKDGKVVGRHAPTTSPLKIEVGLSFTQLHCCNFYSIIKCWCISILRFFLGTEWHPEVSWHCIMICLHEYVFRFCMSLCWTVLFIENKEFRHLSVFPHLKLRWYGVM
jgi:hypothetical protein